MEKRKRRILHILVATIIACVVIIASVIYVSLLNRIVRNNTIDNVREMAEHDQNSIDTYVEHNWDFLERIGRRLHRNEENFSSIRDIQSNILQERVESTFDYIYLVGEDGVIYTDTFLTIGSESKAEGYFDFLSCFVRNGKAIPKAVFRYDLVGENEKEEYLVYGIDLNELRDGNGESLGKIVVGERNMFALLGLTKVSSIQDGLIIENFLKNGVSRGYSSVVDMNGQFIVDARRTGYLNETRNLFTYITECKQSDLSVEQVQAKMQNSETFSFYRTDTENNNRPTRRLAYCMPFGDTDIGWYFIMSIDESVFSDQSNTLITMNVTELAVVLLVVIVSLVFVMFMQNRAVKAMAKEKAQGEFLSNMSHEIRTPLNGLVGLNFLVMNAIDDPSRRDQVKEWLAKSHSTANYLLSLVNDVLDMSKLQAGKMDIVSEPLLLETVVDAIWSMQRDNIEGRGVRFISDINIVEPCILGDEVRIKQILMNIVGNAAKFTPKGGYIKFSLFQERTDDTHVVTTFICEDTGCGMSKEFTKKIFDIFSQERNKNSGSLKGTGLGMAISKLLVDAMHGEIIVDSELEKGSTFTVKIPAEISSIPEYMKLSPEEESEKNRVRTSSVHDDRPIKVLVAEDNELNAEILLEILGESGFITAHAQNGKEAVEMFSASAVGEFDIILMDMRMPIMDGCAASRAIRALQRQDAMTVPIFACTANTFEEDRARAMESGMNDFLTKPIDVKVFLQKMESIGLKKQSDQAD